MRMTILTLINGESYKVVESEDIALSMNTDGGENKFPKLRLDSNYVLVTEDGSVMPSIEGVHAVCNSALNHPTFIELRAPGTWNYVKINPQHIVTMRSQGA